MSSLDLAVLRVIKRKEQFDKVEQFITNTGIDENTKTMIACFKRYYEAHPNDAIIDMDIFRHLFFMKWYPKLTRETKDVYSIFIDRICDDVTLEQQASIINALIENDMVTLIANDIDDYQNEGEFDIVQRVAQRHEAAKQMMEIVATCDYGTIETLKEKPKSSCSYRWHMRSLALAMRPIEGGDNIAVIALSDVGKTSFSAQLMVAIAKQTTKPIIWLNNEGPRERVQYRMYGVMLRRPKSQIVQMLEEGTLNDALTAEFGRPDPVRIYDVHSFNSAQIEELLKNVHEEFGIAAVLWDMIANITLVNANSFSRDDKIEEARYKWTRMLGTRWDYPNIMTCQQSHNKDWVKYPSKHEMKDSKVGVQGALDLMLFITQPEEAAMERVRFMCAPKNKLALEGVPALRLECRFDKTLGIYYEE